ncbi:uncharacterized protein ATC70_010808 [Mucor velutinosus]|uniref:Methyltransferase type 11 domain-containing protein n=1 Tax=Mucor velutinosus TaxID=708070 RepID=A0AAN7DJP9_9FUNG|nr:hypothetical protein ATC70_010808 [Mucor velutinosus]
MGNSQSDIKHSFGSRNIPKHLKPLKKKKKSKKSSNSSNVNLSAAVAAPPIPPLPILLLNTSSNEDDVHLAGEEADFVGSGPRGAFRWFKGRRYLNHAEEDGLNKNLLPNDQLELDRMRVLAFIIRWAFKGNNVAPVQDKLQQGIQVLNVGYGPGMWPGHHIIDMALDHYNSHFTAVDVLDLLPADFEDTEASIASNQDGHELKSPPAQVNNLTVFTPMHPNLSSKLQNTTTPVIDSSTLDSSFLLSQIDEMDSSNISSCMTVESSVMSTSKEENDDDAHLDTLHVPLLLVNGEPKQPSAPAPCEAPKKRTLLHNLDFYQANVVNAKLPFADNHFDYVKQRLVTASYTLADWKRVMAELVRVTKPGGYIELLEIDYNTHNLGPNGRKWERELIEAARLKRQMEPRIARHLADLLKTVGLIDVSSKLVSIPLGSWGLDLGELWKQNMEKFADSTSPLLSKLTGVSVSEYRRQWYNLLDEVRDKQAFSNIHAAWGRKPLDYDDGNVIAIDWSLCPPFSTKL